MAEVGVPLNGESLDLDVCRGCQLLWCDPSEFEKVPAVPPPPAPEEELSPRARERLALARVDAVGKRAREEAFHSGPSSSWQWIPAVLGLPVEDASAPLRRRPWATWGLAAAVCIASLLSFVSLREVVEELGLVPARAFRYGGLTWITSFFLHAGVWHLVGNVYFLLVFGDNVEEHLGAGRFLALVTVAALTGDAAHILADPRSTVPCIGASGGISAVIVYYALRFPRARIGFFYRLGFLFRWVYMRAWVALVLWLLLQFVLAYGQLGGMTNVSAQAHLGGAAVGLLGWFVWRRS